VDNPERIKEISAPCCAARRFFGPAVFPREGKLPAGLTEAGEGPLGISVLLDGGKNPFERTLRLIPRIVTVGVGCRRGAAPESLKSLVYALLENRGISPGAVEAVASIDLKREEPAVLKLAEELGVPAFFYSAEALAAVPGVFTASQRVMRLVGVDNVCERSAVLHSGGEPICPKTLGDGVTASLALRGWKAVF
jgi:cobalt-precorrin 5A hydrolase